MQLHLTKSFNFLDIFCDTHCTLISSISKKSMEDKSSCGGSSGFCQQTIILRLVLGRNVLLHHGLSHLFFLFLGVLLFQQGRGLVCQRWTIKTAKNDFGGGRQNGDPGQDNFGSGVVNGAIFKVGNNRNEKLCNLRVVSRNQILISCQSHFLQTAATFMNLH